MDQVVSRLAVTTALLVAPAAARSSTDEATWLVGTCVRLVVAGVDKSDTCMGQLKRHRIGALTRFGFGLPDGSEVGFLVRFRPPGEDAGSRDQGVVTAVDVGRVEAAPEPATGLCSLRVGSGHDTMLICRAFGGSGIFEGTFRGEPRHRPGEPAGPGANPGE